ncbi:General odorant-binding protein 70 [Sergentomyia squamirostris]
MQQSLIVLLLLTLTTATDAFFLGFGPKKVKKCHKLPQVDKRIQEVLTDCQEEVKNELLREILQVLQINEQQYLQQQQQQQQAYNLAQSPIERFDTLNRRSKRDAEEFQHPTTVSHVERQLAGCLLRCFYRRSKALDYFGYPTLYGVVQIYTDGIDDHRYFMAVLRASDECLNGIAHKYKIHTVERESCSAAFDTFDCLSDKITEYCSSDDPTSNDLH